MDKRLKGELYKFLGRFILASCISETSRDCIVLENRKDMI